MNTAESAFYAHLTDADSLDYIVREGFAAEEVREVLPTELGRFITQWAIEYFYDSGRTVAPSKDAILETWADFMEGADLEINDEVENDSIQWAIDQLRSDYADYQAGEFAKEISKAVRQAHPQERAGTVQEYAQKLHLLAQRLISRKNEMDGAEGIADALKRYDERVANDNKFQGMTFGLTEVDEHTLGVHPGELAVVAATSGGGKSWFSIMVLLNEFARGRKAVLFTLENDVEMTYDRIACVQCRVDYEKWQRGDVDEGSVLRVKEFLAVLEDSPVKPLIIQPDVGEATGQNMIRRAVIEDCQSVIIDQLSHIEPVVGSKARQRNDVVAEIVKDLYKTINNSGTKLPLLLLHQINRKGREEARKIGRYLMDHLGEATQVENASDLVLAIYQSPDHVIAEMAELQMLKQRRIRHRDWNMVWRPAVGDVRIKGEINND